MRAFFGLLVVGCVFIALGSILWTHRHLAVPEAVTRAKNETRYTEQEEAERLITINGPLADYIANPKPGKNKDEEQGSTPRQATASDHVGPSPVGTSSALLHRTFSVSRAVELPFSLPPHATGPQLRGTYQSFIPHNGRSEAGSSDSAADVEFLLLNEEQFADFLNGRRGDAVFWASGARQQDIDFRMPPTFDQPVKYYLVFRNTAQDHGKRIVQADFHIDF